jgi:pyridoxamine 5'-phosphate oxidase
VSLADRRFEYETAGLDVADVDSDPIAQWWAWYRQAETAGCTEPHAFVVATVDGEGLPDARNVLVRDVDARGFTFFTNYGSAKSRELDANGRAAGVFSWLQLHRQVKIRGSVERVDVVDSDAYFATRPRNSQIGAWASPQSEVLASRAVLEARVAELDAQFAGGDVPRPPHWGGWRIVPGVIEFWQGRPSRLHDRLQYTHTASGAWTIERLAP